MEFELSTLSNLGNAIITSEQSINSSYNSSWNDDVHESFNDFVYSFENEAKALYDLIMKLPELLYPLKEVDSNILQEECQNLLSMAERG